MCIVLYTISILIVYIYDMAKKGDYFHALNNQLVSQKGKENPYPSEKTNPKIAFKERNRKSYKQSKASEIVQLLLSLKEYSNPNIDENKIFYQKNLFENLLKTHEWLLNLLSFLLVKPSNLEELNKILNDKDIKEEMKTVWKNKKAVTDAFDMIMKLLAKKPCPLSDVSSIWGQAYAKIDDIYKPTKDKLRDAFSVMKACMNKRNQESFKYDFTHALDVFEVGLLPYYFPQGEWQSSLITAIKYYVKQTQWKSLQDRPQRDNKNPDDLKIKNLFYEVSENP